MPEYLAPGVYVEETSFRAKSIEGVGTSTTGFVGATRYGPVEGEPELITSFSQFERIYGGIDPLSYSDGERHNYLAYAVKYFFDNGGSRLYVARAFSEEDGKETVAAAPIPNPIAAIAIADRAAAVAANKSSAALETSLSALTMFQQSLTLLKVFAEGQVGDPGSPDAEWTQITNNADAQLGRIDDATTSVQTVKTAINSAYNTGVNAGEQASTAAADPSRDSVAILTAATSQAKATATTVENAAQTLASAATTFADLAATAVTPGESVDNKALVADAITEADRLINTAVDAINSSTDAASSAITTAAQTARIEKRISVAQPTSFWKARFPGKAGNITVAVNGRLADNVLRRDVSGTPLDVGLQSGDLVIINPPPGGSQSSTFSATRENNSWTFTSTAGNTVALAGLTNGESVYPLQISVEATAPGRFAQTLVWNELTVSKLSARASNSMLSIFAEEIVNRLQRLETPIVLEVENADNAAKIADDILHVENLDEFLAGKAHQQTYILSGGSDGSEPDPLSYEGTRNDATGTKTGLSALEDLEEISIIGAPGYSHSWPARKDEILSISQALMSHCDRLRYRVAVLDSPDNLSLSGVREYRGLLDTTRAALYYPWITVVDPISNQRINLPPSGFVAGIYARNDVEIGVHKAPANEVVRGAVALESTINKAQQDILNPIGINCIRAFENRGIRVWGARTISSDPEWKYLNIRRYFAYLEASIDKATQWSVFQPNGDRLWDNVRRSVEGFLENEWREGRLAGSKIEQAFFVRCDRSTMTQNDLDNGRLICLIGVAPLYPAEFVIFRIGQWTADRR